MLTKGKNQVMKPWKFNRFIRFYAKWSGYFVFLTAILSILWSCAVAPTKKVMIQDIDQSYKEGTIISAKRGAPISIAELFKDLKTSQVIYVGENHTNSAHHDIQLKVIKAVFEKNPQMAVGMEMFDHSYQDVLDMWSAGGLNQGEFLRKTHWYANWRFAFSLYSDILNFIKEKHIRLVGLNIPFHIPAKIRVGGIENLRDFEKKYLPKKIDTSKTAHREYLQEIFVHHNFKNSVKFEDFYMAQCVWEDAMASMVSENLNNNMMVVLAGNGHIKFKYGIPDRAFSRNGASFRTIYLAPLGGEVKLDVADYIWVTP
jgi:uncharacterized iron-regulated protein